MKHHPAPQEWMSFLYGEDSPARHAEFDAHLRACDSCRRQVEDWRATMGALDGWPLPGSKPGRSGFPRRVLRWSAAAAILLAAGFAAGRLLAPPSPDWKHLQAALRDEIEARLAVERAALAGSVQSQQEEFERSLRSAAGEYASDEANRLFTVFAKLMDEQRRADQDTYVAALKQIQGRLQSDYTTLRNDLNTVAVNADDKLQALAALTHPTDPD